MCGRAYQTYTPEELALRYFNRKPLDLPDFSPNYNLAPTQLCPVIIHRPTGLQIPGGPQHTADPSQPQIQLKLFGWGLIPHWSKDIKSAYKMINARSETVAEKPSFRSAIRHRRCIVPLSGFYEWKREGDVKRPFAISLKGGAIMSVAGIWETWEDNTPTFSILTTESNSFMHPIHDRMPVILNPESAPSSAPFKEGWLNPEIEDPELLKKFFTPCPSAWLEAYEVAPLVNNPRNNTKAVLKPLN